jgi:hypothetical protein
LLRGVHEEAPDERRARMSARVMGDSTPLIVLLPEVEEATHARLDFVADFTEDTHALVARLKTGCQDSADGSLRGPKSGTNLGCVYFSWRMCHPTSETGATPRMHRQSGRG